MKHLKYFESVSNNDVLFVVDVQKSFSKFFSSLYLHSLMSYCKKFKEVYQIFDNHVVGKSVKNKYLYRSDPDISITDDIYKFPNQVDIIEKRYNYNVTIDFYKDILDKDVYLKAKNTKLKVGDKFETKYGSAIVYIGNNHKWFEVPKKLINIFNKLKDRNVTLVGGSDQECYFDIYISAKSFGLRMKRDWNYIYSATNSPI